MKRVSILVSFIFSCVLTANSHKKTGSATRNSIKKTEPVARWTGYLKRDEKITHSNEVQVGTVVRHAEVFFTAAMPTMNRDDGLTEFNYTDDKGTGTLTEHGDMTNVLIKQRCVYDCSGSGVAELHTVIVREWDNTYDIEAITPVCKGTSCTGEPFEETMTITVSNEKFTNGDVLSGTKTVTAELPGKLGTVTATTTWHLTRVKEDDVELIVTPLNYDNWLPVPGKNGLTKGDSIMTINLKLQGKNGKPLKAKAEKFELTLHKTSKERGITINYPTIDPDELPDLRLLGDPRIESKEGQFVSVGSADGINGKAWIASYDGGGWTTLTVEAILTDTSRVRGMLLKPGGETEIRIPKRAPDSKIGEAWLKANGDPGEMFDEEKSDGNDNHGDGLTAYEEYRGVISENKFKRLSPKKKELGVQVKRSEVSLFAEGIQWLENAADIKVIRFSETEIPRNRRLNMNAVSGHSYEQYVLRLKKDNLPRGELGSTYPVPGIPAKTYLIVIDWDQMPAQYQQKADLAKPEPLKFTIQQYLASTIAHELAHGLDIAHHGIPYLNDDRVIENISNADSIFDRHGKPITKRPIPLVMIGRGHGTVESGNLSCFVNYYPFYQWGYTVGVNGENIFSQTQLLPLGTLLCRSDTGTAANATKFYFGKALGGLGNCLGQMKFK